MEDEPPGKTTPLSSAVTGPRPSNRASSGKTGNPGRKNARGLREKIRRSLLTLPRRVVPAHPTMVTVPMSRHPVISDAAIPIPGTAGIIGTVADRDGESHGWFVDPSASHVMAAYPAMAPTPTSWHPVVFGPVLPIGRATGIIGAISDRNGESLGARFRRHEGRSRDEYRNDKKSVEGFHAHRLSGKPTKVNRLVGYRIDG